MSELPRGWAIATVFDIASLHDSRRVPLNATERSAMKGAYPYYGANGLVDHVNDYIFDGHYVLLAEDGGYFDDPSRGVAYEVSGQFWVNNHAHILQPLGSIPHRFLTSLLNATNWLPYVGGSTRLKLTQGGLQQVPIAVPPLPEQRRIVAKIDSLTAKSARARDNLDHIPRLVEKYKQTVLAAVFAKVNQHHGVTLVQLTTKIGSGATPRGGADVYQSSGVPFIRSQNVYFEGFEPRGLTYIDDVAAKALAGVTVRQNDVLLNITGASIGRACIVPDGLIGGRVNQHVAIIRCKPELDPTYLLMFLWTPAVQGWVNDENYGVTRQALTKSMIEDLVIPLPTIAQQEKVVREIRTAFAWIDRLAKEASSARKLVDHLDQAVLAKAFRGELVPQDPNDEPADVLLERIKAERAQAAAPQSSRRGRKTKPAESSP